MKGPSVAEKKAYVLEPKKTGLENIDIIFYVKEV